MKVCTEWWTALSAYVDDALAPDECQRVEVHLQECEACRTALMDLQILAQTMRSLPSAEPPPMLKARILSATVDQPTFTEKLAMYWRQWVWRASLVGATAVLMVLAWRLVPQQVPEAVSTVMSGVREPRTASVPQQARQSATSNPVRIATTASSTPQRPRAIAGRSSQPAPKLSAPKVETRWSAVARTPIAPEPAPADVLDGEPVIEEDEPYIDVNSPPAGSGEQVATQPEEGESTTVARRISLPAELLNQGTSGLDALREQIRIRNQEQLSGELKRKIQRKQVDVDVITVRF